MRTRLTISLLKKDYYFLFDCWVSGCSALHPILATWTVSISFARILSYIWCFFGSSANKTSHAALSGHVWTVFPTLYSMDGFQILRAIQIESSTLHRLQLKWRRYMSPLSPTLQKPAIQLCCRNPVLDSCLRTYPVFLRNCEFASIANQNVAVSSINSLDRRSSIALRLRCSKPRFIAKLCRWRPVMPLKVRVNVMRM